MPTSLGRFVGIVTSSTFESGVAVDGGTPAAVSAEKRTLELADCWNACLRTDPKCEVKASTDRAVAKRRKKTFIAEK